MKANITQVLWMMEGISSGIMLALTYAKPGMVVMVKYNIGTDCQNQSLRCRVLSLRGNCDWLLLVLLCHARCEVLYVIFVFMAAF